MQTIVRLVYINRSGGFAFFVKNSHTYETVEDLFFSQCDEDDLLIKLKLGNNKSITVGTFYRHPSSSFVQY